MKNIDFGTISLKDLAALISEKLRSNNIDAVLVGGSCVSIYSENKYQSYDLDYVTYEDIKKVENVLKEINFLKKGRHFMHPDCPYFIEFVAPPVAIGNQPIESYAYYKTPLGTIKMLKVTDSIKDRLASYYHWDDIQALDQAIAIYIQASEQIDLESVKLWSKKEGQLEKFELFLRKLNKKK